MDPTTLQYVSIWNGLTFAILLVSLQYNFICLSDRYEINLLNISYQKCPTGLQLKHLSMVLAISYEKSLDIETKIIGVHVLLRPVVLLYSWFGYHDRMFSFGPRRRNRELRRRWPRSWEGDVPIIIVSWHSYTWKIV